uniref:Coiled-coil domain-containing protein 39 n=2 Tax=Clytia hemisphaerica TaxID=252671 RepID=A0A7M5X734_9CNID
MQRRDNEIDDASLRLMELRVNVKTKQEDMKDRQQFLDDELNNNKEKEKKISMAERNAAKLRLEYQNIENSRQQFQDELETLKYKVDRTAKDLESTRRKANELKNEVAIRQDKLSRAVDVKEELIEQLTLAEDSKMTAEERSDRLEAALKKEQQRIVDVEKELAKLREMQFKKTQDLYQVRQMETNTNAEIHGAKAASRNLSSKLYKLDQESLKQQEIVYNQDFQLQQAERKLIRLQGDRTNEEKNQLNEKIKQLTGILEGHQNKQTMLTAQLKKLGDDLRRANRDLSKGEDETKNLTNKIGELTLHNDSSERELRNIKNKKEDLMVDENLLKLEIKRLRDQLFNRATEVLSLEDRRLLLETAMKERRQEIYIHTDMLKAQVKTSEDERQKISAELHERISKIEKLRKRYEILMVSMAPPEGEEEKTQAYYVIKAAQEKEELQRTGDQLDAKIRKAEKEIRALKNTVQLMNDRNSTYRKSFNNVEETSEEYEKKMQLEEQLRAAMDKLKYKKRQMKELQEDLRVMQATAESLTVDENELVVTMEEKQRTIDRIFSTLGCKVQMENRG